MSFIIKAVNVEHPGARGAPFWIDAKGNARYDKKPVDRHIVSIVMADGTEYKIEPRKNELDENGQVKGGQAAIREIVNRELFGEYGFKPNGQFWQNRGILFEYEPRTAGNGKVVVDPIQRHDGFTSWEFRDSSVERAYGKGLPQKIEKYRVAAKEHEALPAKMLLPLSNEGAATPPIEELGIHNIPPRDPQTKVAIDEPLTEAEDPVAIATAYLDAFLNARKPSQAKTPKGQEKARAERKGQFSGISGHREIKPLPMWAINKYDSAEHLQQELSRGEDGHPLTTLITLGMWDPNNRSKRMREQLTSEWMPFIRQWARKYASVYASTDAYKMLEHQGDSDKTKRAYIYDRERDLINSAVVVLLEEANAYQSNDEPEGQYSRFDLRAKNAIKNFMAQTSKQAAIEHGAMMVEDLAENQEYRAPTMISPREHFELRHYEPMARKIVDATLADLPPHVKAAFDARMWRDDPSHPDQAQERHWDEMRARQHQKRGKAKTHWGRPWVGEHGEVSTVADQLADTMVTLRDKSQMRLGDLEQSHQTYYLEKWFNEAEEHLSERLKTKRGGLTPDGVVVQKWLRLEAKLANVNRREIDERIKVPTRGPLPQQDEPKVMHNRADEHPAIGFFRTNRELAQKLGIANKLDIPTTLKNMNIPRHAEQKLKEVSEYHRMAENLHHVHDLAPVEHEARQASERAAQTGAWIPDAHGSAEWSEGAHGVTALHNAVVKLHTLQGVVTEDDAKAARQAVAEILNSPGHQESPEMAQDYVGRLQTGEVPTNADLATWKTRSHANYRKHANRLHVIEFERERRALHKSLGVVSLRKAMTACVRAYDLLGETLYG